ncbi:MAG: hypothetical protein G3M70_10770 [Candidatus Nitronauta litoralis]|uniref:Uncharacterized protein n=1 Tax=Candidatus Nitronauta litoralis TaxID=2705533 RepID=A0A7T0G0I1_9BACT|nr:MAG: hypothetical protein G3M70_10770 [Candidatus Nitronauta litoralis]
MNRPGQPAIHTDNFPRPGDPSDPFSDGPEFVFTGNEEMDFYALKKWIKLNETKANLVYLDEEQRKPYKLSFHEKDIYRNGGRFTTPDASSGPEYLRQSLIAAYAVSPLGIFYCMWQAEIKKGMRLNHSSFMSGRPVMCAGVLEVRNGTLLTISNNSGHYKPSIEDLQAACQAILMSGYIVDDEHCMALVYDGKGKRFPGFEGTEFYNEILGGPVFPVPFKKFAKHGIAAVKSRYGARPSGRARRGNFLGSARGTRVHRLKGGK